MLRAEIDRLTQLLCQLCEVLKKRRLLRLLPRRIRDWWVKHQQWDAERRRVEATTKSQADREALLKKHEARLVKSAKKKLHPEELAALQRATRHD